MMAHCEGWKAVRISGQVQCSCCGAALCPRCKGEGWVNGGVCPDCVGTGDTPKAGTDQLRMECDSQRELPV